MLVLAIDTSGPECAAGLYDSATDNVVSARSETIGKGHAERLTGMIEEVFAASGERLQDVDRIAVTVGPGSFTGIRVGVATARGLALALGIPAVGVTTLAVIAADGHAGGQAGSVLAMIDARRDEIYCQAFGPDGQALDDAKAATYQEARALAEHFDAVRGSGKAVIDGLASSGADAMPLHLIGRIGASSPADKVAKPLYLRGPGAKPQTGFAIKHA
jgi:tRNA threonylcarbamoyladenosine biosynthesis protein TsaB